LETILQSGLETYLFAIPFALILVAGMFGLDAFFAAPKRKRAVNYHAFSRSTCSFDKNERMLLFEPEGTTLGEGSGAE
jgi:hypothetical protein